MTTNDEAFDRARAVLPGGVNSPVRAYGSVGGTPRTIVSARGAFITDVEGREYIDMVGAWGPALLGHAHPETVKAVQDAAAKGLGFGAPNPGETLLAEEIRRRVPIAERVRLVSTGTEATMTAIRLARGATGRDLLIKFAGHYHGHSDGLLAEAGSGVATLALPGSAGVPAAVAAQTIVVPYNDLSALEAVFAERGADVAAIIFEAAAANMGVVSPVADFNARVTELAHRHGALVIQDEVLTGFRVSAGGWWGLDRSYQPDLLTFGKVVGGGLPLAALGGRAEIMDLLAPLGPVYQAGTLSGNPLAVAAGLATLQAADGPTYGHIDRVSRIIATAVSGALTEAGVTHVIQVAGSLFSIFFREQPARNYDEARDQDVFRHRAFFHSMLDQGISLPPSVFEAWFVSSAHGALVLDRIFDALPAAARAAAEATPPAS